MNFISRRIVHRVPKTQHIGFAPGYSSVVVRGQQKFSSRTLGVVVHASSDGDVI